jgi:hypothetical protein
VEAVYFHATLVVTIQTGKYELTKPLNGSSPLCPRKYMAASSMQ